tara:strand:- start:2326 stop:2523 length:198 start_codon:yes stop_codon:yes gene_type:complete
LVPVEKDGKGNYRELVSAYKTTYLLSAVEPGLGVHPPGLKVETVTRGHELSVVALAVLLNRVVPE